MEVLVAKFLNCSEDDPASPCHQVTGGLRDDIGKDGQGEVYRDDDGIHVRPEFLHLSIAGNRCLRHPSVSPGSQEKLNRSLRSIYRGLNAHDPGMLCQCVM